ncbi:MAG: PiT family inorganic phosphate transporter [Oleiphilaceae bacterium]|jgi:PiT family inorganic phosphate transporter
MSLKSIKKNEQLALQQQTQFIRIGLTFFFMAGILIYVYLISKGLHGSIVLLASAVIGGYMAMNIGANDVANNVGPAVGSKAITLFWAIVIAAIFEAAGALLAGGEVVSTIKNSIIDPSKLKDTKTFVWLMLSALLAGAVWLNLATLFGAPVSTTHSIVGGVLGAGIAAGGFGIANWEKMAAIAASWVISPVLGGVIAASFLLFIKKKIIYQTDMIKAARKFVPVLIAFMAWAFSTYLVLKGLKKIWKLDFQMAALIGFGIAIAIYFVVKPFIVRKSEGVENSRESVNTLFTIPLIFAAALLSFAHGANDVANAVGPLAAISDAIIQQGGISSKATIPLWVMMIGALGISLGLLLFGPKIIKTVGSEITELDKSRAFCVAMAAAITVIIASQLGLPVSSTHIAIGGIFGVGFLREYLKTSYANQLQGMLDDHEGEEKVRLQQFLSNFESASVEDMEKMIKQAKIQKTELGLKKSERNKMKKLYSEKLVKRSAVKKIVAAWIITVPASATIAACVFFMLQDLPLG